MTPTVRLERTTVEIDCYGKRKVNGLTAYRIGQSGGRKTDLLITRGWQQIPGKGRGYDYMVPPPGIAPVGDLIKIEADTPVQADLENFAAAVHAAGQRAQGHFGDWPWRYTPAHTYTVVVNNQPQQKTKTAEFIAGFYGAWHWVHFWREDQAAA